MNERKKGIILTEEDLKNARRVPIRFLSKEESEKVFGDRPDVREVAQLPKYCELKCIPIKIQFIQGKPK
jgi:hypothetical protein